MSDIVIIGGGVIGLSIAWELARQGASIQVLDQGPLGQEASWAGAGIIPPGQRDHANSLEQQLRAESFVLWPVWSQRLRDETGLDNEFINCGGIELADSSARGEVTAIAKFWRDFGCRVEELSSRELRTFEPQINPEIEAAVHLPELCQVRNPRHLRALIAGCSARGVELRPHTAIVEFDRSGSRIAAVRTASERIRAERFIVCSGAWTQELLARAGCRLDIEPVRGQIVLLNAAPLPIRRVIEVGPRYVVPRADGRVLIGSTEEWVGFDKSNTADAVAELIRFGTHLIPALKSAQLERCWAGLRPCSRSGLPYVGHVPDCENLFVAAGHFRLGLTMSPITAVLMRQMILGQSLSVPVSPLQLTTDN